MGNILVTVPHATCPPGGPGPDHLCDIAAPAAARQLAAAVRARGAVVELFLGDIPRGCRLQHRGCRVCDLNRMRCADTPWRRAVRATLARARWLLDVHSSPGDARSFGGRGFVILLNAENRPLAGATARRVIAAVRRLGIGAALLRGRSPDGRPGNAIIAEAAIAGVPAMLLEFSERLGAAERQQIAEIVAAAVLTTRAAVLTARARRAHSKQARGALSRKRAKRTAPTNNENQHY